MVLRRDIKNRLYVKFHTSGFLFIFRLAEARLRNIFFAKF